MKQKASIKIAVFDDDPKVLENYLGPLRKDPSFMIVGLAQDSEAMYHLIHKTTPDMALLDITAPESATNEAPYSFVWVISDLLQRYPHLKILILTMHADLPLVSTVMRSGAHGYLLKGDLAAARDLPNILRGVMRGDTYLSADLRQPWQPQNLALAQRLTRRQLAVLSMCAAHPNERTAQLAERLNISGQTFRNHLAASYERLGVVNKTGALIKARELGLITPLLTPHVQPTPPQIFQPSVLAPDQLRVLYRAELEHVEHERQHWASTFHALLNKVGLIKISLGDDPPPAIAETYQAIVSEMRRANLRLNPLSLHSGLSPALKTLAQTLREQGAAEVDLEVANSLERYPADVERHLFRIAQLVGENAVRHACAGRIVIHGELAPGKVQLQIEDDGLGFEMEREVTVMRLIERGQLGLAAMYKHALVCQARLRLTSRVGQGTTAEIVWPTPP